MKSFRTLISCLCLLITGGCATDTTAQLHSPEAVATSWQEVVDYAKENLPQHGQLRVKPDGFGYIKVDDAYIHTLLPMLGLEEEGFKEPPYFRRKDAPGAHISVFYENEHIVPEEVGQSFSFEVNKIAIVKPSHRVSYVILQVTSPELEKLRVKYGLSPKLFGHEFHISIGKKNTEGAKSSHHRRRSRHH